MGEEYLSMTPKEDYNMFFKLIQNLAFSHFMQLKETHKKLDQVEYKELKCKHI